MDARDPGDWIRLLTHELAEGLLAWANPQTPPAGPETRFGPDQRGGSADPTAVVPRRSRGPIRAGQSSRCRPNTPLRQPDEAIKLRVACELHAANERHEVRQDLGLAALRDLEKSSIIVPLKIVAEPIQEGQQDEMRGDHPIMS